MTGIKQVIGKRVEITEGGLVSGHFALRFNFTAACNHHRLILVIEKVGASGEKKLREGK